MRVVLGLVWVAYGARHMLQKALKEKLTRIHRYLHGMQLGRGGASSRPIVYRIRQFLTGLPALLALQPRMIVYALHYWTTMTVEEEHSQLDCIPCTHLVFLRGEVKSCAPKNNGW